MNEYGNLKHEVDLFCSPDANIALHKLFDERIKVINKVVKIFKESRLIGFRDESRDQWIHRKIKLIKKEVRIINEEII